MLLKLKFPHCITDYLFCMELIDHAFKQIIGLLNDAVLKSSVNRHLEGKTLVKIQTLIEEVCYSFS